MKIGLGVDENRLMRSSVQKKGLSNSISFEDCPALPSGPKTKIQTLWYAKTNIPDRVKDNGSQYKATTGKKTIGTTGKSNRTKMFNN